MFSHAVQRHMVDTNQCRWVMRVCPKGFMCHQSNIECVGSKAIMPHSDDNQHAVLALYSVYPMHSIAHRVYSPE
jgi:hypothetical protein